MRASLLNHSPPASANAEAARKSLVFDGKLAAREGRAVKSLLVLLLLASTGLAQSAPSSYNLLTAEERAAGYKLLFDGTRTAFRGVQKSDFLHAGWKIVDGTLSLEKTIDQSGKVTGGDLATMELYGDFDFQFEYKLGISGNSGVLYFIKTMLGGKPQGSEFQIIDDTHHPDGLKGGPLRHTGSLYAVLPVAESVRINPNGWNSGRLVVQGAHVEHWVNGEKALEYEAGSPALQQAVRASNQRLPLGFGSKVRSSLVLLDQGDEIAFRNLKIKPLQPAPPPALVVPGSPVERTLPPAR